MANPYETPLPAEADPSVREFSEEEKQLIEQKRRILSSLALFVGKDFRIPVELNEPGGGWHWDFQKNVIRADPLDLLEKPMDYLRFVISHEGGHRRISRVFGIIPDEVWRQPGFAFMSNSIEDPRDNNFVAENYPKFREWMELAYDMNLAAQDKARADANDKLGFQPRFMQAGFEYIRQWFKEVREEEQQLTPDLPDEVRAVVEKTLDAARDSCWLYPSKAEADASEDNIVRYAKGSFTINNERVWPDFRRLVEQDLEDQKLQEFFQDQQGQGGQGSAGFPGTLTEEEREALKEYLEGATQESVPQEGENGTEARGQPKAEGGLETEKPQAGLPSGGGRGKPVPLDQIPDDLKQKIREFIDSLPEDARRDLEERAERALKEFEDELNQRMVAEDGGDKSESNESPKEPRGYGGAPQREGKIPSPIEDVDEQLLAYREFIAREMKKDRNIYEAVMREESELIDWCEQELRRIFKERPSEWETGFSTGKRIDIKKRIQEKFKGIPALKSKSWQRRELPEAKECAVSLLLDLSGSMVEGKKIEEAFRIIVILTEALNRLSVNVEAVGFNVRLYEYQQFGQGMSDQVRERLSGAFEVTENSVCKSCGHEHSETDLGWATDEAAKRLATVRAVQKFLITVSDLRVAASLRHSGTEYALGGVVARVGEQGDIGQFAINMEAGKTTALSQYPDGTTRQAETKATTQELIQYFERMLYT